LPLVPRLVRLVALACVAFAGLAFAYVTAGPAASTVAQVKITICHATASHTNPFVPLSPNADGVLSAHAHHPGDIIPPFEVVEHGTTIVYPGKNMDAHYGSGFTGAELLANGCRLPAGPVSVITVPEAIIEPARAIIVPATATHETIVERFVISAMTETAPEMTTVVTVPAGSATTVTLPERVVTLPSTTETIEVETVVHPSETVTLPGTVETVTAGATATVATVTGPNKVRRRGTTATRRAAIIVPAPRELTTEGAYATDLLTHPVKGKTVVETVPRKVTLHAQTVHVRGTRTTETVVERLTEAAPIELPPGASPIVTVEGGASVAKRAVVTVTTPSRVVHEPQRVVQAEEKNVIVVVIHAAGCPPGTALFDGSCHHIAAGEG
jgi:hypothetical protein